MSGAAGHWRFAPGDWYAVLGEDVAVVLPPSERPRVAALWELADAGAGAEELLDAVLAGGVSRLSDLVLVSRADGLARVLVRGGATASVDGSSGPESVVAEPGAVWSERLLPGDAFGRLHLDGTDEPADLEVGAGLVRVSTLEFGDWQGGGDAGAHAGSYAGSPAEPYGEPAEESEDHRESQRGIETELMPQQPAAQPPPEPQPVPEPQVLGEPEPDPADTGETPVVPDGLGPDRDGHTAAGAEHPPFERPPVPGQEVAPPVVPAPVATLVFSTGDVVEVDRVVLVGRAPEARRFASHEQPRTVAVMSPHQEISSTHLEIRPGAGADHGSAIVTDLGSTNGTVLVQPGLPPEDLQPGIAVSLIPGAVLDLGDGVTIQVTNP